MYIFSLCSSLMHVVQSFLYEAATTPLLLLIGVLMLYNLKHWKIFPHESQQISKIQDESEDCRHHKFLKNKLKHSMCPPLTIENVKQKYPMIRFSMGGLED